MNARTRTRSVLSEPTAVDNGWRKSIALLIVLAPVVLAVLLTAITLSISAVWQRAHAAAVSPPTPASVRLYGMLSYALGCWIAVALAWLWSSRRGLRQDVFVFRRPTLAAVAVSVAGFVIAMYGVPVVTQWLSQVTGGPSHGVRIDFNDPQSIAIFLFLFVATAPICEEILYRGLLVTWLRRLGLSDFRVLLVGSLVFGANHLIPLGFVWSAAMVGFGAILFWLRLRYESLSPGWLTHFLFNAHPFLTYPLIAWIAPAALPGHL